MKATAMFFVWSVSIATRMAQFVLLPIYATEADKHIGELYTIICKVHSYKRINDNKSLLLFCGRSFPRRYFTIIVEDARGYPQPREGEEFELSGMIIRYNGMPAVKIHDWHRLKSILIADHTPPDF